MDRLQAQLGSLLTRPMEDAATKELAEAARARVEVLRSLLRTPAVVGDDEYERLLKEVFDATSKLLGREPTAHRLIAAQSKAVRACFLLCQAGKLRSARWHAKLTPRDK